MVYASQLEKIRLRVLSEFQTDNLKFWESWNQVFSERPNLVQHTVDQGQYIAEHALFKFYWPNEPFIGQNPEVSPYARQFRMMYDKCVAEGRNEITLWACYRASCKKHIGENKFFSMFQQHYNAEKELWDTFWRHTGQRFPGIDPSLPNPPPAAAPRAPAPAGPPVLQARQPARSDSPNTNGTSSSQIQPQPSIANRSSHNGGLPAASPLLNSNNVNVPNNTRDFGIQTALAPPSLAIEAATPANSRVAAAGSFLENVARDYTNLRPLEKALQCKLSVEQVRGSDSYPLRIYVHTDVNRGEDVSVAMANAAGARKLLGEWGSKGTEDAWCEIIAALKLEEEGRVNKKRKL